MFSRGTLFDGDPNLGVLKARYSQKKQDISEWFEANAEYMANRGLEFATVINGTIAGAVGGVAAAAFLAERYVGAEYVAASLPFWTVETEVDNDFLLGATSSFIAVGGLSAAILGGAVASELVVQAEERGFIPVD